MSRASLLIEAVSSHLDRILSKDTIPEYEEQATRDVIRDTYKCFLLWYSDSPKYSRILANRDYFRSKGVYSTLRFMSPEDYLQECANGFGCTLDQSNAMIDDSKVQKYVEMIRIGHKFPCPILSYNLVHNTFLQEGRHRAKACQETNISPIPVWILITKSDANDSIENLPLMNNNYQLLSRVNSVWQEVHKAPTGFIRNWNFVDKSKAQELIDQFSTLL